MGDWLIACDSWRSLGSLFTELSELNFLLLYQLI